MKKGLLSFLSETWSISPHPHGFLPRRSYLSNLLVFEKALTRMMEEGRTVDVICCVLTLDVDTERDAGEGQAVSQGVCLLFDSIVN